MSRSSLELKSNSPDLQKFDEALPIVKEGETKPQIAQKAQFSRCMNTAKPLSVELSQKIDELYDVLIVSSADALNQAITNLGDDPEIYDENGVFKPNVSKVFKTVLEEKNVVLVYNILDIINELSTSAVVDEKGNFTQEIKDYLQGQVVVEVKGEKKELSRLDAGTLIYTEPVLKQMLMGAAGQAYNDILFQKTKKEGSDPNKMLVYKSIYGFIGRLITKQTNSFTELQELVPQVKLLNREAGESIFLQIIQKAEEQNRKYLDKFNLRAANPAPTVLLLKFSLVVNQMGKRNTFYEKGIVILEKQYNSPNIDIQLLQNYIKIYEEFLKFQSEFNNDFFRNLGVNQNLLKFNQAKVEKILNQDAIIEESKLNDLKQALEHTKTLFRQLVILREKNNLELKDEKTSAHSYQVEVKAIQDAIFEDVSGFNIQAGDAKHISNLSDMVQKINTFCTSGFSSETLTNILTVMEASSGDLDFLTRSVQEIYEKYLENAKKNLINPSSQNVFELIKTKEKNRKLVIARVNVLSLLDQLNLDKKSSFYTYIIQSFSDKNFTLVNIENLGKILNKLNGFSKLFDELNPKNVLSKREILENITQHLCDQLKTISIEQVRIETLKTNSILSTAHRLILTLKGLGDKVTMEQKIALFERADECLKVPKLQQQNIQVLINNIRDIEEKPSLYDPRTAIDDVFDRRTKSGSSRPWNHWIFFLPKEYPTNSKWRDGLAITGAILAAPISIFVKWPIKILLEWPSHALEKALCKPKNHVIAQGIGHAFGVFSSFVRYTFSFNPVQSAREASDPQARPSKIFGEPAGRVIGAMMGFLTGLGGIGALAFLAPAAVTAVAGAFGGSSAAAAVTGALNTATGALDLSTVGAGLGVVDAALGVTQAGVALTSIYAAGVVVINSGSTLSTMSSTQALPKEVVIQSMQPMETAVAKEAAAEKAAAEKAAAEKAAAEKAAAEKAAADKAKAAAEKGGQTTASLFSQTDQQPGEPPDQTKTRFGPVIGRPREVKKDPKIREPSPTDRKPGPG